MTQSTTHIEETAQKVRQHLEKTDQKFLSLLGITNDEVKPDYARCSMAVREDMLNTGRVCHGGFIFFLADNAFAYACLSSNRLGATLSAHIMYTQGAKLGERLTATAQMITSGNRTGTCDVEVTNPVGDVVARYQGVWYRMNGMLVEEERHADEH